MHSRDQHVVANQGLKSRDTRSQQLLLTAPKKQNRRELGELVEGHAMDRLRAPRREAGDRAFGDPSLCIEEVEHGKSLLQQAPITGLPIGPEHLFDICWLARRSRIRARGRESDWQAPDRFSWTARGHAAPSRHEKMAQAPSGHPPAH